ncbi:MAG: type III secretion system export apparatus subunit SctR [Puniceicoccales bacterium]|jgi:type III secretion protein R|nr:type III secretion system export apparatus subunit SctR [Puniceicoccales bacterium]
MTDLSLNPITIIVLLIALSLAPFVILLISSFVKMVVVMNLVRNALGVQQVPPNMVLNGLAIMLSIYVMFPVVKEIGILGANVPMEFDSLEKIKAVANTLQAPIQKFLNKHTSNKHKSFFLKTARKLWPLQDAEKLQPEDLIVLIPAFTVTELTEAFQIGFLLYLPFIAVDLIVSNILLALGMMMVSPMTISLPFKLMLFVIVDGWSRLIHGLVLTYR